MSKRQFNKQKTISLVNSYKRQCFGIAQNVFDFENLPSSIWLPYVNAKLLYKGAVAFFYDEVMEMYLCLPFTIMGKLDVYYRPVEIQVYGANGYTRVIRGQENFVIIYDNMTRVSIIPDIMQYVNRLTEITRVQDTNLLQQKTPRVWLTNGKDIDTLKSIINDIDSDADAVMTYDNLALDKIQNILAPAPYLIDKLQQQKREIWNEFLRLVGVANLNIQKKERVITDEVINSQGGTIASRFNRYMARKIAVDEINKKFGLDIKVTYFDKLETKDNLENDNLDEGGEDDV